MTQPVALTLLVHTPDADALQQLISDLPALKLAAAERPDCVVALIGTDGSHIDLDHLQGRG